jgi:hypothetical protein
MEDELAAASPQTMEKSEGRVTEGKDVMQKSRREIMLQLSGESIAPQV